MELVKHIIKQPKIVVAPLGDIQYTGYRGNTALDHLKRHIDRVLSLESKDTAVRFVGMGDYIDFMSPSNRLRLDQAALYDTSKKFIEDRVVALVDELFEGVLKPTKKKWLGLLEGHHFFELQNTTSDEVLSFRLDAPFLGTSTYIRLEPCGVTLWAHHGVGNSTLPSGPLNKLYHVSHGFVGADVYLIGHTCKLSAARLSRPRPEWGMNDLVHSDIFLVNTGGFSKSSIVGHRVGRVPRGDYAEARMLTPAPLSAPIIHIDTRRKGDMIRVEV
jgi:hypothetical protein